MTRVRSAAAVSVLLVVAAGLLLASLVASDLGRSSQDRGRDALSSNSSNSHQVAIVRTIHGKRWL